MTDYSKMTQEDFDNILNSILQGMDGSQLLLAIPGIYEIVSEEFNNEVLTIWENKQ